MQASLGFRPVSRPAAAQPAAVTVTSPPPDARPFERGPHDLAVLGCVDVVVQALRPRYDGPLDFKRWLLPASATWRGLVSHYQAQLPPGWTAERLPEQLSGCRFRAWSGGGGQVLAIALTDGAFEAPEPFKVLIVATRTAP